MAQRRLSLLILLLVLPACRSGDPADAASGAASEAKLDATAVHAIVTADSGFYQQALLGMQASLEADLAVHYLDPGGDPLRAQTELSKIDLEGHILAPLGGAAAAFALQHSRQATVVVLLAPSPNRLRELRQDLCGVTLRTPAEIYVRSWRQLSPGARRLHVVYASDEGRLSATPLRLLEEEVGLSLSWSHVPSRGRLQAELPEIDDDVEGLYLPIDPDFDRESFILLSDFAARRRIPLMVAFAPLVSAGGSFGYEPDAFHAGGLGAQMINRLRGGASCAEEGLQLLDPAAHRLILNEAALDAIGLRIPSELQLQAQSARAIRAGLDLYLEGRYEAARSVFAWAAGGDASNPALSRYLSLITERLSGREIDAARRRAAEARQRGDLVGAETALREALRLNPQNAELRQELQVVVGEQCQRGRAAIAEEERAGRWIEALRRSAQLGEGCAASDVARLRQRLRPQLASELERGLALYESRDYRQAIEHLERALLIEPGNGQARAYLDLARKKLAALERLRRLERQP